MLVKEALIYEIVSDVNLNTNVEFISKYNYLAGEIVKHVHCSMLQDLEEVAQWE